MRKHYIFRVHWDDRGSWWKNFEEQFPDPDNDIHLVYNLSNSNYSRGIVVSSDPAVEVWIKLKYQEVIVTNIDESQQDEKAI